MTPYFQLGGVTLYHGDCRALLPRLGLDPAGTVCVTDPPYNIGAPVRVGSFRSHGRGFLRTVGQDFGAAFDTGAVRPGAWLSLMPNLVATFYDGMKADVLLRAAAACGFRPVQDFHWCKSNPGVPMRSAGFAWAVESGYILRRKGVKGAAHNNAAGISPNWFLCSRGNTVPRDNTGHPTQKALPVMRWLVAHWTFPGQTVLDPFAGSGTTLLAARDYGRAAVGIEAREDYCAMAARRLRQRSLFVAPLKPEQLRLVP